MWVFVLHIPGWHRKARTSQRSCPSKTFNKQKRRNKFKCSKLGSYCIFSIPFLYNCETLKLIVFIPACLWVFVSVRLSSSVDISILDWIQEGTLTLIMHKHAMAWSLRAVIETYLTPWHSSLNPLPKAHINDPPSMYMGNVSVNPSGQPEVTGSIGHIDLSSRSWWGR